MASARACSGSYMGGNIATDIHQKLELLLSLHQNVAWNRASTIVMRRRKTILKVVFV